MFGVLTILYCKAGLGKHSHVIEKYGAKSKTRLDGFDAEDITRLGDDLNADGMARLQSSNQVRIKFEQQCLCTNEA